MRLLGRLMESRATTFQQVWGADGNWDRGGTWAGKTVNRDSMLGLSAVFACIRFIVDAVSTLPVHDFGPDGEAPEQPDWLERPVPRDPSTTLVVHLQQVVSSLLIEGNSFTFADPDVFNPAELRVLDPRQVTIKRGNDGMPLYRVRGLVGGEDEYDWTKIIHIPLIRLPGELRGLAPLEAERQTFSSAIAAEEYGARFLGNGTTLGGVIEMPTGVTLDEDQAKELVDKFELRYSGSKNAHRPGLLTGGATWKQLSVTPEQAQFLQTRQYDDERIFRIYRVPPALAGMVREGATSNASSVSQALAFEKHTIRPLVTLIETAYRPLVPPGHYLKFNTKGLLRGDPKTQAEIYHYGLTDKWQTVDETRGFEDMAPFGGADGGLLQTPNNNAPNGGPLIPPPAAVAEPSMRSEPFSLNIAEATFRDEREIPPTQITIEPPLPANVTVLPAPVDTSPFIEAIRALTVLLDRPTVRTVERDAAGRPMRVIERREETA